jgi:uncharacterized membrane protein
VVDAMWDFLFLLTGLVLLAPVAIIYLVVVTVRLKRDVRALQDRVTTLENGAPEAPVAAPVPTPAPKTEIWAKSTPPVADSPPATPPKPEPVPTGPSVMDRFIAWMGVNWIYVVSAVSLALAGVFLVQYGVEAGLLPPAARIMAALAFGVALLVAGEVIRRHFGDGETVATAYLPSVFSGAGLITLFGAILAARHMYGLIGAEVALIGLIVTALVGLVFGWFYGPLMAAVALIGGFAAPFVVGGSSPNPSWVFGYLAILAALGLGIDTMRQWRWVTVLTLTLGYGLGGLLALSADIDVIGLAFGVFAAGMAVMSLLIPVRRLSPDHGGPMLGQMLRHRSAPNPSFVTQIAGGSVMAATLGLVALASTGETQFWLAAILLATLSGLLILWSHRATALQDTALIPMAGLFAALLPSDGVAQVIRHLHAAYDTNPEAAFPMSATIIVGIGVALSVLALMRALATKGSTPSTGILWAGVAAFYAPSIAILLDYTWKPAVVIGDYAWALHAAALGAIAVWMAERLASKHGPEDRLRTSLPILAALSAIVFAVSILLTEAALTLAIAVTVVVAATLDRAYRLPLMGAFITAGIAGLGTRLIVLPGLDYAYYGPLFGVAISFLSVVGASVTARVILTPLPRDFTKTVVESAALTTTGIFATVLITRAMGVADQPELQPHWAWGLNAVIWLCLVAAQLWRAQHAAPFRRLRLALAALFGLSAIGALISAVMSENPLISWFRDDPYNLVRGPAVLNSLALAYLAPALVLAAMARYLPGVTPRTRKGLWAGAIALSALWLALAIRHVWQGAAGMPVDMGITQPELYSYTIALLLIGGGLFYQAVARRSATLRRAALIVLGTAIVKVFWIDAAGLTGLMRVLSFLLLGLGLAGLAWLGRFGAKTPDPEHEKSAD